MFKFIAIFIWGQGLLFSDATFASAQPTTVKNCAALLSFHDQTSAKRFFFSWNLAVSHAPGALHHHEYEEWPTDGARARGFHLSSYNVFFNRSLNYATIDEWALERRSRGETFHVVDFFGSAVFSANPENYTSLTGVRFKPLRREALPDPYPVKNWYEVIGDIYKRRLWDQLDLHFQNNNIHFIDLGIIRPVGPLIGQTNAKNIINNRWPNLRGDQIFFKVNGLLLRRIWERTNPNGGVLLVEINDDIVESALFDSWVQKLQLENIKVDVHISNDPKLGGSHIRLERNPDAPFQLPLI